MELRTMPINLMLVGLFALAMIAFAIGIYSINDTSNTFANDPRIINATNSLNSSLNDARVTSDKIKSAFESEGDNPIIGFGNIILFSILGAGKLISGITIGMFLVLTTLVFDVLGINPIVFAVISAGLIISIVLLSWRLYRQGS
jgi:hypothetical protein